MIVPVVVLSALIWIAGSRATSNVYQSLIIGALLSGLPFVFFLRNDWPSRLGLATWYAIAAWVGLEGYGLLYFCLVFNECL